MAKTLKYLVNRVEVAAGGTIDPRIDAREIVNEAGNHLCSMHEWEFLSRPPVALDFGAGQDYIDLPSDFEQLLAVEVPNALETTVTQTTMAHLLHLRASILHDPLNYFVAVEYPEPDDASSPPPKARLAIWPTPGSSSSGALQLSYRAGWRTLYAMTDVASVPADAELLLVELIVAFAKGSLGGDSLVKRLDEIENSTLVSRLKRKYGMVSGNLGEMKGGIVGTDGGGVIRPFRSIVSAG